MNPLHIDIPAPISKVLEIMDRAGHKSWLVGGCVRDSVMGVEPHDYDLTTSATPDQTIAAFKGYHVIETGLQHGTVTVVIDGEPVEITTFRTEGEYLDNRHPSNVSFTRRIEDDLQRRDFTINAMAYRPDEGLLDLFGGQEDIRRGIISCVGDPVQRFNEDGLRILRALRFASRLGFALEEKTAQAAFDLAPLLHGISVERVFSELKGIVCGKGAGKIVHRYAEILLPVLPELSGIIGFHQNSKYHCCDVLEHTCRAIDSSVPDTIVRLALLLHDIGKPDACFTGEDGFDHYHGHETVSAKMADEILLRLRSDNHTRNTVVKLIESHDCDVTPSMRKARHILRDFTFEEAKLLLEVKKGDRLAHAEEYRDISDILALEELLAQAKEQELCFSLRDLAVNGYDMLGIGVKPGHIMGCVLNDLLNMVINEEIPNEKDALLERARQIKDNYTEE